MSADGAMSVTAVEVEEQRTRHNLDVQAAVLFAQKARAEVILYNATISPDVRDVLLWLVRRA